jgi:DNA-binding NarL/FixJ family response regulator
MTIRVVLCDDHRMLSDALAGILAVEADIEVVGTANDGKAALDLVRQLAPDVLVLDIAMAGMNGIEVAQHLRDMNASVKTLALSAYDTRHYVQEMLKAGAAGYITKACAATDLTRAIREVAAGRTYLSTDIAGIVVRAVVSEAHGSAQPTSTLSAREQLVLRLVAEGLRSSDVAQRIGIAVATVEVHRRNIMRKLDLHSVVALARYAMREGLTQP